MNNTKQDKISILWGIVIGGSLGFMEAAISLRLWEMAGKPDFLVRPRDLSFHAHVITMGGILVGIIFGAIVSAMASRRNVDIRFLSLYLSLMLLGILVYIPLYYVLLRFRLPLFFACDPILFIVGLLLVRVFSKIRDIQ